MHSYPENLIENLSKAMNETLPGPAAHGKMMTGFRPDALRKPSSSSRDAAVLLLLYPDEKAWYTVFIQRKLSRGVNAHRGQISLPGGKMEASDSSLADTALRETEEEIGMDAREVRLLGQMSELFIPVSDFKVLPFVGWTEAKPSFTPQEEEVDDIIPVSLHTLLAPENLLTRDIETPTGLRLKNVPYFNLEGKVLWGATAMIVCEFLEIVQPLLQPGEQKPSSRS